MRLPALFLSTPPISFTLLSASPGHNPGLPTSPSSFFFKYRVRPVLRGPARGYPASNHPRLFRYTGLFVVSFWEDQPPRPFVAPAFLLTWARPVQCAPLLSTSPGRTRSTPPCAWVTRAPSTRVFSCPPGLFVLSFWEDLPSRGSSYLRPPTPEALRFRRFLRLLAIAAARSLSNCVLCCPVRAACHRRNNSQRTHHSDRRNLVSSPIPLCTRLVSFRAFNMRLCRSGCIRSSLRGFFWKT